MAMLGCRAVGIDEPKGCKKLVVYVEIDRCATDAVQAVTGCSLGKRTLKFCDYGKMAATFVNTETDRAVRVVAKDDARALVGRYAPEAANPREAQKQAYRVMPEEALFAIQPVTLRIPPKDLPGRRGGRVQCSECGEGVNFEREVHRDGRILCIPCSRSFTATPASFESSEKSKVLFIVGYKKVGKTTLIERLIPELCRRGYRVGTVKHHHSDFPASIDHPGTDTWRHRQAGAASVVLATPTDLAAFRDNAGSPSLDQIVEALGAVDIALVEGFHEQCGSKIEVLSEGTEKPLCANDPDLLAIVTSNGHHSALPTFTNTAIPSLADFIESTVLAADGLPGVSRGENSNSCEKFSRPF